MKKVIITNKSGIEIGFVQTISPDAFIQTGVNLNTWGLPERWVLAEEGQDEADIIERATREVSPAIEAVLELVEPAVEAKDAVLDQEGNVVEPAVEAKEAVYKEVSPAVPAVTEEWVKLRADYTIEIVDITAEHQLAEVLAKRKAEYPSAEEFLNAYFDGGDAAVQELNAKRLAIKAKYPKPGA